MKNLYKFRFVAVLILFILSTLTSKQATAQDYTKEWQSYSMGEYILSCDDQNWGTTLFEERNDFIIIGAQSNLFSEPNPVYNELVFSNKEKGDPIVLWSKKTKDFILKSNWNQGPLLSPIFYKGYDRNTFFVVESYSNVIYKAVIVDDNINYTKLNFYKNPKDMMRLVCESDKYIITITSKFIKTVGVDDWYYFDSAYVYDAKTYQHIKTMTPFAGYRHMSMGTIAYKDGKFFLGGRHSPSMSGASFIFDVDNDTSYLSGVEDGFNRIYVRNIDGEIYATSSANKLKKWVSGTTWESIDSLPIIGYGFPTTDQHGRHYYWVDWKNQKGQYFDAVKGEMLNEFFTVYRLTEDGWPPLKDEHSIQYYQKFGYTWSPKRIVGIGTDTFAFGDNMICKIADRNVGINDVSLAKLLVYPNPATGFVTVSTPEDFTFTVIDITGKIVLTGITNQIVDVSFLNKGIYFIQLAGYTPTKLVVE